jgi:hypothetical protein
MKLAFNCPDSEKTPGSGGFLPPEKPLRAIENRPSLLLNVMFHPRRGWEAFNPLSSAEEAAIGIFIDDSKHFGEGRCFRIRLVAVPIHVGTLPVELPGVLGADVADFSDRLFDPFAGTLEGGALEIQNDVLFLNPLTFTNFIAEMKGRTPMNPELRFEGFEMLSDFVFGEGHGWCGLKCGEAFAPVCVVSTKKLSGTKGKLSVAAGAVFCFPCRF